MSLLVDSWTSNLSEIDRTVSCVPKYQSSIVRSFNRVVCTLPPVCRLLYNVGKFDKCIKIHSNVSLYTLKGLLNFSGKKPGNTCSKYSLILSSLSLQKEVLNPDHELKKAEYGLKISP